MITITAVWLCLITRAVYGTTNIINCSDSDNNCEGNSSCTSLPCALKNLQNNTVINITSKVVTLNRIVGMGSGNLNNITITANGTTIMCNNTGGVHCESCSDITILGITWYQCGRNEPEDLTRQTPAIHFTTVSNLTIHKCTFCNSTGCPVYIKYGLGNITINDSYFMDNVFDSTQPGMKCAGLHVTSRTNNFNLSIISSGFCNNDYYSVIIDFQGYRELAIILIDSTEFSNNSHGLYVFSGYTESAVVQLSNVFMYGHTALGISLNTFSSDQPTLVCIDMLSVSFVNNVNPLSIVTSPIASQQGVTINIRNSIVNGNIANDTIIYNEHVRKRGVLRIALTSSRTSVTITNCHFYNNFNGAVGIHIAPSVNEYQATNAVIRFTNVTVYNTTTMDDFRFANIASVSVVTINTVSVNTEFTNVSFISNTYSISNGAVLLVENYEVCGSYVVEVLSILTDCMFENNTASDYVVLLRLTTNQNDECNGFYVTQLSGCNFENNFGGDSIVHTIGSTSNAIHMSSLIRLRNSRFCNNQGTAIYSTNFNFEFLNTILFINNTANSGAAIHFEKARSISSGKLNADLHFVNNSVLQRGGALYFNLIKDNCNVFQNPFNASFINNSANIAGNSIYFSVPHTCQVITNTNNESSLLYVPNKFNYSQSSQTKFSPIVTSPYNIKLYPPAIAVQSSSNDYVIYQQKMLGEPIQFNASVFDYFNSITESVIFSLYCKSCGDDYVLSTYQIAVHNHTLNELKIFPIAHWDVTGNVNILVTLISVLPPIYRSMNASLSIWLSSCYTGYIFDKSQRQCICYPYSDIVHCTGDHSEIKIGYWIGFLTEHYTSSICPSNYCNFAKRTETSLGYYDLSRTSDDQCSSHRTGVACGECKPGYTLAYDSPKCINTDKCSAGMIFLVVVLTILYWIAIVAVVFGLMYFLQFQVSSGYAYGIIYYYSIVDILLGNNISDDVFQLVAILSSFAKLTPQLFGQLCLVEGLSGIDQQFIHYTHALAVSLILLTIVVVTRYSPRLAMFVSRCIICVICLLLLLSYTSIASTSLQLLRPLTFNDVDEVRTYSSPDIKYFTHRHLAYAIVAIFCEVIVVIGLPLFLLLEPILSRGINFVKIKPLLDQFRGCYKDKYRWFAAYYLICRQVIILIVYVGNGDYYNKLYYLQTACIIIAMIHGWVQPYKKKLVNGLDGVILLVLVLVVNLNTFTFLSSISSQLSIILIILPLFLLSLIAIRKLLIRCYDRKKKTFYLYNPVGANNEVDNEENDNDYNEANNIRFASIKLN